MSEDRVDPNVHYMFGAAQPWHPFEGIVYTSVTMTDDVTKVTCPHCLKFISENPQ